MTTVYAAMADGLLVATDDGGEWVAEERLADHRPEFVLADRDHPERVFVGTFESGLLRSTDGGATFERVGADGIESDAVMSGTVDPANPEEVWVGTEPSAVYRSPDGGESWEAVGGITDLPSSDEWYFPPRPHTHHVRWLELDPNDPSRVYVGIEAGAFVYSDDRGETWRERPPGSRRDNHTLTTHPDAPGRLYAAAGDGYGESTDGGDSWRHPQEGLDHRYVWGLAVDPGDPDTVLVSAASGAGAAHSQPADSYVYRKRGGGPWERLTDGGLPVGEGVIRAVLAGGHDAGAFWACNNRGVFRSTDAGTTWTALDLDWPDRFADQTCRGLAVI